MLLLPLTCTSLSQSPQVIGNSNCKLFYPGNWFSFSNNLVTLAENFHLQNYFLKVSVLILTYLQHRCVVIKANISHTPKHHKPKSMHLNGKKLYICYCSSDRSQAKRHFGEDGNQCSIPSGHQMRSLRRWDFRRGGETADLKRQKINSLMCGYCFAIHIILKSQKYSSIFKYLIYLSRLICIF